MRPEEIADQELAEAIQKSVEEAGTRRSPVEILNLHSFLAVPQTVCQQSPFSAPRRRSLMQHQRVNSGEKGALFLLMASNCTSVFLSVQQNLSA